MEGNELLRVNHLKKYFQTPHGTLSAVDDVTFGINERETLGVVGESGCGKSTLGRCILRLHEPTAGEVVFEGKNILACDKKEIKSLRSKMQIIFQDPYASLNPRMTVSQAIAAPLIIQGVYSAKEKEKIQQLFYTLLLLHENLKQRNKVQKEHMVKFVLMQSLRL